MGITNPFQMVVAIVLIFAVASVIRARSGLHLGRHAQDDPKADTEALRTEIKALKDRVAVLERLATDSTSALDREFEKLRRPD
ncbi:hypothetical protein BH10PSE13_BH10PSE13_24560 [soil metagenome]